MLTKSRLLAKAALEHNAEHCVFFDTENKGCQIYGARPIQCRTWPFWDSNLKSEKAWKETCEECPGSGNGKVYSLEEIEVQRKQMRI